jgi:hypothetical protein
MALDSKENRTKRQIYQERYATLWDEMLTFRSVWQDLADFVKPRRIRVTPSDRNRGDRRNQKIIDTTATLAHRNFIAGMHLGMSNPSSTWFRLSVPDPHLAKFKPVQQWLHTTTQILLNLFLKSNIYAAYPVMYGDLGLFGTAAMGIFDDPKEVFHCQPYPIGTYALGMDHRQRVDTFVREYTMTVRGLVREFGFDNCSKTTQDLFTKGDYNETVEVCWVVAPNEEADASSLYAKNKPWASCHFEKAGKEDQFLRESGFGEFPIVAPRWERSSEDVFGTGSPGLDALGGIRALQTMARVKAKGVAKMVNPTVNAPSALMSRGVNLTEGGVNFVDSIQGREGGVQAVHDVRLPINELREDINDERSQVRRCFYEDLFLLIASSDRRDITAREIEERVQEKAMMLGHGLQNSNDEMHEPSVDRCFPMANRAGLIPPAPPDLENMELKVEFLSPLAQAQKRVSFSGTEQFLRTAMPLIAPEMLPESRYKLKSFRIIDELGDAMGVNPELLASDDEAMEALQGAQQAQARAQQAEIAATMAKAGKDLGATPVGGDTALSRLLEGVGQ